MPGDPRSPTSPSPSSERRTARGGRRVRGALALLLASALPIEPALAERGDVPVQEVPPAACDVCTPGKPPPPLEVQERTRELNEAANWRRQPSQGDTIPLGTATRVWLQRAWASGRLQPGVANTSGSTAASRMPAFRGGSRTQARTSLASRSRDRLADRRSTRDEGRRGRSRRGSDQDQSASSFRSSGMGSGSSLGTNRSNSMFGPSSFSSNNGGFNSE